MSKFTTNKIILLLSLLLVAVNATVVCAADILRFSIGNKTSPPVPPYQWYDFCTKQHQGFNKELYRRLADDLGLKAEFIEADFAVESSQMQVNSLAIIAQNKADFGLTHPVFIQPNKNFFMGREPALIISQVLVLPIDRADINDLNELTPLVGTSVAAAETVMSFKRLGVDLSINKTSSLEESLAAISNDEADYWITPKFIAQFIINEFESQNKVKFSKMEVGTESKFYLVTNSVEHNVQLMAKIDDLLVSYHKTGYIDFLKFSVMREWFANRSCAQAPRK